MSRVRLAIVWMLLALTALDARAAVACRKKNEAMFARETCRKKQTAVDLSQFGAVGSQGDPGEARAFACSQSEDEATPALCPGRAARA